MSAFRITASVTDREDLRALIWWRQVTAGTGVYAAHVPISTGIGAAGPESQADTIAEHYWDIYTRRDGAEHPYPAA